MIIESTWTPCAILNIFVLTWVFDSFAYLIGIKFGKRKIMPKISPKKSWEGFIGGLIFTLIAARLMWRFYNRPKFEDTLPPFHYWTSRIVQVLLYALCFWLPVQGSLMTWAGGFDVYLAFE